MNRKEKDTVPAAEYCVLKKMRSNLHFLFSTFFFSLEVEDQFFWLDTTQARNSQACNSLELAKQLWASVN